VEPKIVEYLKTPLNKEELSSLLKKLGMKAEDIVRNGEKIYKEQYAGKEHTESQWISILLKNPTLIERPIVVKGDKKEATEDIQKFGGAAPLDEPYLEIPLWSLLKKRGVWLIVLFLGQMLTASAMSFYEVELAKAVVLALFIPLIISSGGNSGSQAATLVIRALALGEVVFADVWRVLRRELLVGLGLGLVLGVLGALRVVVWGTAFQAYGEQFWTLGFSVGVAVISVVAWGNVVGSMLPLILRRLGLDPATSSAPFVATFIDVTGILIYFNIAMLVMSGRLF
jgi:magnesium transporter